MLLKILALIGVLLFVYILFFKKPLPKEETKKEKKPNNRKLKSDTMIECAKCDTFVSEDEAIIKDGAFYCSKSCAGVK